jgi:DNA-binding FrmR family transcriptional regulator
MNTQQIKSIKKVLRANKKQYKNALTNLKDQMKSIKFIIEDEDDTEAASVLKSVYISASKIELDIIEILALYKYIRTTLKYTTEQEYDDNIEYSEELKEELDHALSIFNILFGEQ